MPRTIGRLFVNFAVNANEFVQGLRRVQTAQQRFNRGIRNLTTRIQRYNRVARNLPRLLFQQRTALLALIGAGGVGVLARQWIQAADALQNVQSRLSIVTDSTAELRDTQRELFQISQQTRADFLATGNAYARLAQAGRQAGLATEELLRFQRLLNQTFIISGSSTQEAAAASIQLAQGLSSARLGGDELRSVLEGNIRFGQALSDSLGVTVGELRDLGAAGVLNARTVVNALSDQAESIESDFAGITTTVAQAYQRLENDLVRTVGAVQNSAMATDTLVEALNRLRNVVRDTGNIEILTTGVAALVDVLAWIVANAENIGRSIQIIAGAFTALTLAIGVVFPVLRVFGFLRAVAAQGRAARAAARANANLADSTEDVGRSAFFARQQMGRATEETARASGAVQAIGSAAFRADANLAALGLGTIATGAIIARTWEDVGESVSVVESTLSRQIELTRRLGEAYTATYGEIESITGRIAEINEQAAEDAALVSEGAGGFFRNFLGFGSRTGEGLLDQRNARELAALQLQLDSQAREGYLQRLEFSQRVAEAERLAAIERERELGKLFRSQTDLEAASRARVRQEEASLRLLAAQNAALAERQTAAQRLEQTTRQRIVAAGTEASELERVNEILAFRDSIDTRQLRLQQELSQAAGRRAALQEQLLAAYNDQDLITARVLQNQLATAINAERTAREASDAYDGQISILSEIFDIEQRRRDLAREHLADVRRSNEELEERFAVARELASAEREEPLTIGQNAADLERQLVVVNRARREREAVNAALQAQSELVARIDEIQRRSNEQQALAVGLERELQSARDDAQRGLITLTQEQVRAREQEINSARESSRVLAEQAAERQATFQQDLEGIRQRSAEMQAALQALAESRAVDQLRDRITGAFQSFTNSVLTNFSSIADAARQLGQTIVAAIFDRIVSQRIAGFVGQIFDNFIFGSGSGTASAQAIRGLAAGGSFRAGEPVLVGERGAELAIFDRPGQIIPNSQLTGGSGGLALTYAPTINGSDRQTVKRVLEEDRPRFLQEVRGLIHQDMGRASPMSRTIARRA